MCNVGAKKLVARGIQRLTNFSIQQEQGILTTAIPYREHMLQTIEHIVRAPITTLCIM